MRSVAAKTDIPEEDAASLVEEFLHAISEFVEPAAWRVMAGIASMEGDADRGAMRPEEQRTIKEFLLELSEEEDVEDRRAAGHARAVAETIRQHATPEQVDELDQLLDDEFLALFESRERGELTGVDLPESWQD